MTVKAALSHLPSLLADQKKRINKYIYSARGRIFHEGTA